MDRSPDRFDRRHLLTRVLPSAVVLAGLPGLARPANGLDHVAVHNVHHNAVQTAEMALALLLAAWIAHWVAEPLQRIAQSAAALASGRPCSPARRK